MGPADTGWWTKGRIVALLVGLLVVGGLVTGDDTGDTDVSAGSGDASAPVDEVGRSSTRPRSTTTAVPSTTTTRAPSTTTTTVVPATTSPAPAVPGGRRAVVGSITDGDTFRTAGDERIRLIGIDTPEVDDDACFAAEATTALTRLIPPGTEVVLVADVEPQDRFGRTLSYVYRSSDGLFVNLELARIGVALQLTIPPNVAHADDFGTAVAEARAADRGLWGACPAGGSAATTSPPPTAPPVAPTTPPAGNCHPSYPTVCIPPPPPDLDCPEIPHRRFPVVGDDPHGFDGDDDGIGCESG